MIFEELHDRRHDHLGVHHVGLARQRADIDLEIDAVDDPLTPSRFFDNLVHSISFTRLHIPSDPEQAERELCTRSSLAKR